MMAPSHARPRPRAAEIRRWPLAMLVMAACPQPPTRSPAPQTFHVAREGDDRNPGTAQRPWASLQHAARQLGPGDHVLVHGGRYAITSEIRPHRSGRPDAWIVYAAAPGEQVVIDASGVPVDRPRGSPPFSHDQGAFQLEGVAYIRVQGLTIQRSHRAGFTIRDSHHVALLDNTIDQTFTSGIAAWDTNHDGEGTSDIEIRGNTLTHTNTWEMLPPGWPRFREPPHEAISLGGVQRFEVSHNHVHHCDKEGIDIKENSAHGRVHHNHVHHVARQGLYVDGWFAALHDVELHDNVVHDCRGAGLVISVENGPAVEDLRIHHNLLYDNDGTGLYLSRWGDGPRRRIRIDHNTIHHNGHGPPREGQRYFWMTGGIYLYSANLEDIEIRDNVVSGNRAFQIGLSRHLVAQAVDPEEALRRLRITVVHNLVEIQADDAAPIEVGSGPEDRDEVTAIAGRDAVLAPPTFVDAAAGDLRPRPGSAAIVEGPRGPVALGALALDPPAPAR